MSAVCFVTTSPLIANSFLAPHLARLARRYDVSLALPVSGEIPLRPLDGVEVLPLPILRRISPWQDLLTLRALDRLFERRRFAVVHSFAPKAGLLAMHAARAARVPVRLHTFTGQVWASRTGFMRALLRTADRLTARAATHVLADSASQRDFLVAQGVVPAAKCTVLASGSVSGVDAARFRPDAGLRSVVRSELGVPVGAKVLLYLGRLARDKGLVDLAAAFAGLSSRAVLVLVGHDEDGLRDPIRAAAGVARPRVHFVAYTAQPERYLAATDVLCLPSYREGFGTVVIEAAAAGVPAVASRIYGITDAVVDGVTGLLFTPGSVEELRGKLALVLEDEALRVSLGQAARSRALADFAEERVTAALESFYAQMLECA